jgi:hypothetical protein
LTLGDNNELNEEGVSGMEVDEKLISYSQSESKSLFWSLNVLSAIITIVSEYIKTTKKKTTLNASSVG